MSSSDEDPESPAVPPGLFNDRKDSVSMDVDEPTESYDTPPGLFDEPETPKSMTSESSFDTRNGIVHVLVARI